MSTDWDYRKKLTEKVLGKPGAFLAYFSLYDEMFELGGGGYVIQIQRPDENWAPITHDTVLTAAQVLKVNSTLTLDGIKTKLAKELRVTYPPAQIEFTINLAVQTVFMIVSNVKSYSAPNYNIGKYHRPTWKPDETLAEFISRCFPESSPEQQRHVGRALEDKVELSASNLARRLGIEFKGTGNLAEHLLLDRNERVLYFFHHADYLRAQLGLWNDQATAKTIPIEEALVQKGTLNPRLCAETLFSLQSIFFCYNDDDSMNILYDVIRKSGLDSTCCIHDGYHLFDNSDDDFTYVYWGERLLELHSFLKNPPPRSRFERWIRWQTSDSNSFLVAISALIITIFVSVLTLGLTGFQAWVSWEAWKHPFELSG
ncbi:hypothetical protein N0V93_000764 [Gnomoniopsis smithogilvyi]|uniref:Uncharacterized protein n=1 Tax=Gnomoniopsis smithogilvyi TaxID=1191159 RepID=A0A9W9D1N1_9PEZI|nr:hypothetical protein N0V93_000764 [Gnomoniopsis smithogilvyi]